MSSEEHARRLLRELVLPDEADLVVQRPKYWTEAFCWLFFDACDQLISELPEDGLVVAEVCPELAYLTQTVTRQSQDRLRLRALAVLGSAYRANENLDQAEEVYREAFGLIRGSDVVLQTDAANVLFRFSYVLCFRRQYEQAVDVASQSIGIYREAPDDVRWRHLGEALSARGFIHHLNGHQALAMKDWGEAVARTDVKQTPRVFYAVVHNLALGIMESTVLPRDLSAIEKWITRATRYFSSRPLSVPKMKVLWLRGMVQCRFGSTRRGEASYQKAIDGFLKLGCVVEMALVSVTLGKRLYQEHRHEELETLAAETNDACERLCQFDDIKRAIFIWRETIVAKTVSKEVFATTWRLLERNSFGNTARLTPDLPTVATGCRVESVRPEN